MLSVRVPRLFRRMATIVAVALLALPVAGRAAAPEAPAAGIHDAGIWDLIFEKGNRRCRLFLRGEAHGAGRTIAMPPACHYAFPLLAPVTSWTSEADEHVAFRDEAGQVVFDFGPDGTAFLTAVVKPNDTYELMPVDPDLQYAIRMVRADAPEVPAVPAVPAATGVVVERTPARGKGATRQAAIAPAMALPPVTAAEVAGNYAVLRKDRDTGCMVTLEPASARAKLAPACRDQGIVIFDPTGWRLLKGELVLMAKRGHTTALTRRDDKTWANAPATGAALVLKRL